MAGYRFQIQGLFVTRSIFQDGHRAEILIIIALLARYGFANAIKS